MMENGVWVTMIGLCSNESGQVAFVFLSPNVVDEIFSQ